MELTYKNNKYFVTSWDWKDSPDFKGIVASIKEVADPVNDYDFSIIEINTRSDDYAIVIGGPELTSDLAHFIYANRYGLESGEYADGVPWEKAEAHLKEIRMMYTEIGPSGISALRTVIDPLYIRFEKGERTLSLFDEIMELE